MRLLLLLLLLLVPTVASADDSRRAGEIQLQAKDAWDAGDAEEAWRLAQRAISLENGPSTWLAQQIRIEVLEERGQLEQALTHLQDYLALDGLFPEHRAWGEEAERRIGGAVARTRLARRSRRGVGIGLVAGGAVPLGVGIGLLGNYGSKVGAGGDPTWYAGFQDAGLVFLIAGGVTEGIGIALLASSAPPPGAPRPVVSVAPDGSFVLGMHGRF